MTMSDANTTSEDSIALSTTLQQPETHETDAGQSPSEPANIDDTTDSPPSLDSPNDEPSTQAASGIASGTSSVNTTLLESFLLQKCLADSELLDQAMNRVQAELQRAKVRKTTPNMPLDASRLTAAPTVATTLVSPGSSSPAPTITGPALSLSAHKSAKTDGTYRFMFYSAETGPVFAEDFQSIGRRARGNQPTSSISATESGSTRQLAGDASLSAQAEADRMVALMTTAPFWIDVMAPTLSDMRVLQKVFRIHPLTVEDILTEDSREKCELYPHYYFCCFQSFDQDVNSDTFLDPITIFSVVGHNFVLTFHRVPYVHASNVLRRIQRQSEANAYINVDTRLLSITPDWINYALIDDVTDGFLPFMAQLQLEVETIDELVLILRQSEQADMLRRMGKTRRLIITLARLLVSKPDVVRSLIKWRRIKHNDEIILYLSDIQDHLIGMVQNVYHYERIISRAHANYLGQINVEMTKSSNSTNKAVAWLTTMGTVLVPMHVIAGLWGMNVNVPGADGMGLTWFFAIMLGMVVVSGVTLLFFRPPRLNRALSRYLPSCVG